MKLKIKRLHHNARLPFYATDGASGLDLRACMNDPIVIPPGGRACIDLGIAIELPPGHELQVRPRSGLARRHGIDVHLGTVDEDYRGEVSAIVFNHDLHDEFRILPGDRICQAVVAPVTRVEVVEVDELSPTERGANGFGSSGMR